MVTVNIFLWKRPNKDNTHTLYLRITKDRKHSYVSLGVSIKLTDWDDKTQKVKKSYANSSRLNHFLLQKKMQAEGKSLELQTIREDVTSVAVMQQMKPAKGGGFFTFADAYLKELKEAGKYNRYTPDKSRITNFKTYIKRDISFSEITVGLLERFQNHLRSTTEQSERSIVNHLVVIRSVFSYAIKETPALKKYYPFGEGMIQIKFPDSLKVGLNADEIAALENAKFPKNSRANHARNLFLFSFYFAGMRASDVLRLKWSDFQNGRLYYTMGKNDKGGSLILPPQAVTILKQYEAEKSEDDLVFPELKNIVDWFNKFVVERTIAYAISTIDKILRKEVAPEIKLTKKLTMHIARHTFGNLSGESIPVQMLQKLYRHSHISTTIGYQANFIHQDADNALTAVLNTVKPK